MNQFGQSLRVAVLAGGDSPERAVSLASGRAVAAALASAGHETTCIDSAGLDLADLDWDCFEVCFIALHGGAGEDGRVQARLEKLGVAYTGSGPTASRLAMSKSASKERFLQAGVPTPPYLLLHGADVAAHAGGCRELGYPLVIKPDSQGSSLGVGIARREEDLAARLTAALALDPFVVAERWVGPREFTVTILGRRPLPLLEIVKSDSIFSYDAKYSSSETQLRFDAGLAPDCEAAIYIAAVAAVESLGTTGLARVDLMLDERQQPWVLEINTIPGLTERSLAPRAAARAGIDMPALCDRMVRECLTREAVA